MLGGRVGEGRSVYRGELRWVFGRALGGRVGKARSGYCGQLRWELGRADVGVRER